jgi:hypothetical protein
MCPELKQSVTMSFNCSDKAGVSFLIISDDMPEGPGALSLGKADMVECHSSSVGLTNSES